MTEEEEICEVAAIGERIRGELQLPFDQQFTSQTALGRAFGLGPMDVGKLLFRLGLRDGGTVSELALRRGYVAQAVYPNGESGFRWHKRRCVGLIERCGLAESRVEPYDSPWRCSVEESEAMLEEHVAMLRRSRSGWDDVHRQAALGKLAVIETDTGLSRLGRRYAAEWRLILDLSFGDLEALVSDASGYGDCLRMVSPLVDGGMQTAHEWL